MILATRYAKSLLDLAIEKGQLEAVYKDVLYIKSICNEQRDFVRMLESPIIKTDKKLQVIQAVFNGVLNDVTLAFMNIMINKRREMYLYEITSAFIEQYKTHKHILTAVISSAIGLDDTTRNKVLELIKQTAQGEVELIEKTDKKLIGGFVLRINDQQVDTSIARKISNLRKNFTENPYLSES